MKIVFFGTGEFSTTVLKGLVDAGREVMAVVTQPDKVNARNNKVIFSSIKQYCLEKGIEIHQFAKLNLEGEEILKNLNPDIFVTASYGQIIKQHIIHQSFNSLFSSIQILTLIGIPLLNWLRNPVSDTLFQTLASGIIE